MIACASLSGGSDGCYAAPFPKKVLAIESHSNGSQLSLRGCHHRAEESGSSRQKSLEKVEGKLLPYPYSVSAAVINLLLSLHFLAQAPTIKVRFAQVKILLLKNEQRMLQFINRHLLSPHLQSCFHHSSLIHFHPLK